MGGGRELGGPKKKPNDDDDGVVVIPVADGTLEAVGIDPVRAWG